MTEADLNAIAWPAMLWNVGFHSVIGGVVGVVPQRARTAYVVVVLVCLAEAFVAAGLIALFGGSFLAMVVTDDEPLWGAAGGFVLMIFALTFPVVLAGQGGPALFGVWLARRVFRRSQK